MLRQAQFEPMGTGDDEVDDRPGEGQAGRLLGEAPITLVRRRTSPSERSSGFVERRRVRSRSG